MSDALATPTSVSDVVACVRELPHVRVAAGTTKPALSRNANVSLAGLRGILEYDPHEFTITAAAGTPLSEIDAALSEHGQQLAFDPPFGPTGATLGGAVAAGLSGPGRYRSGGVRDFVLGVRAVTGDGQVFQSGSKVVKNSAGFDLPKLMVGSLGQFALMLELTVKVFPRPTAAATVCFYADGVAHCVQIVQEVARSMLDVTCLDVDDEFRVWVRIAGVGASAMAQVEQLRARSSGPSEVVESDEPLWRDVREFQWLSDDCDLVKTSLAPSRIRDFVALMRGVRWRISCGGHMAWAAWPRTLGEPELRERLADWEFPALTITGNWTSPTLGRHTGEGFTRRMSAALDPDGKFHVSRD